MPSSTSSFRPSDAEPSYQREIPAVRLEWRGLSLRLCFSSACSRGK